MDTYIGQNGTFSLMKQLNLEKVYKLILMKHPISRISLAELAGLNKVTVSNCVDFLLQYGVIEEIGLSKPSGGRPPILLDFKADFGVFIGVEYNTISSTLIVTDIAGNILHRSKLTGKMLNPEEFVEETIKEVKYCKSKFANTKMGILGVCMATPNNYNRETGIVEDLAGRLEWKGFPIRQHLQERLNGIPLFMQNVSSAAALGEIHFGNSDPMQHLAYLYGAWGLNLSYYAGGNISNGTEGFAGRFGHTVVDLGGRLCNCGNRGCLEAYASVHALIERLYPEEKERIYWDLPFRYKLLMQIRKKAAENDPLVRAALNELCDYLVIAIVNILNMYNPTQVCIGGYLSTVIDDDMIRYISLKVNSMLPGHFTRNLAILRSKLEEYAPVFGCISVIRNELLEILLNYEKKLEHIETLKHL